jgi:hypothetical protein
MLRAPTEDSHRPEDDGVETMEWRRWSHCCLARLSPGSGNPIRRIFLFYRSCLTNSRNYTYCSNVEYSNAEVFSGHIAYYGWAPPLNLSHPIVPLASTGGYSLHPPGWSTEARCRTSLTRYGHVLGRAPFQLAALGNRRS